MDVLLVDSAPLVRRLATEMLEDVGLAVAAVRDAATALAAVAAGGGSAPRLLLVALRPLSGDAGDCQAVARALATEIGRRCGAAPALLYTGHDRHLLRGQETGPEERFLEEPYGQAGLVHAVFDLLGRPAVPWLRRPRRRDVAI